MYIGVDIGGTKIVAGLADSSGKILQKEIVQTGQNTLEQISALIKKLSSEQKITKPKDGSGITLRFSETPDILAALGKIKRPDQWSVAFALETENGKHRALEKLKQKCCDFVILNTPDAINRNEASFQIFDIAGQQRKTFTGPKCLFADKLLRFILQERREKNTF